MPSTYYTQRRKKFKLNSSPESTYLFVTVINIELPLELRMGKTGLFAREEGGAGVRGTGGGSKLLPSKRRSPIPIA
jgi:hypothetical protein